MKIGDKVMVWGLEYDMFKIGKIIDKGDCFDHYVEFTSHNNTYYDEHELILFGENNE